jgi:hypothetical protein
MSAWPEREAKLPLFWIALLVWALTTFPCIHLRQLNAYHPELIATYLWTNVLATLALSFLGTLLVWLLSMKFKSEPRDAVFWAIPLGILLAGALCAVINPLFQKVSHYPLGLGNFLYFGLLAGAVTGEMRVRSLRRESSAPCSAADLKLDFYIAALLAWAVILKVMECFELVTVQPGRESPAVGAHLFMFLSVALWTPDVCKYLWRYTPSRAIYVILWACASGVLLPPVIGFILSFPAWLLFYLGMPLGLEMAWGTRFWNAIGIWRPVLFLAPGLSWGMIVGLLRWHYLRLERAIGERGMWNDRPPPTMSGS